MAAPHTQPASQASSHFPLDPVSALVLSERETRRRDGLRDLGPVRTGCGEIDEYVLLGGFERGSVVGISAEDEEMGMLLGLQAVAHMLGSGDTGLRSAMVITTQPPSAILPTLRDIVKAQLVTQDVSAGALKEKLRGCLERVSVSRVFDMEGLWEVLGDLDMPSSTPSPEEGPKVAKTAEPETKPVLPELNPSTEIADSDDEDDLSPLSSLETVPPTTEADSQDKQVKTVLPDIIVISHFSTLLTTLFTRRDNPAAHAALQLLSSHLRYLTRNLATSPLIILLNSTTSPPPGATNSDGPNPSETPPRNPTPHKAPTKPLDSTLRSIFNPPPLLLPGYTFTASRKNKPSFGLVFTQLLDLHLLCTRVPRNREDTGMVFTPGNGDAGGSEARFVWVVEVLLDEIGVWEGPGRVRRFREQRWAAVSVEQCRTVDAFKVVNKVYGDIRVVGGFGGPRV